MYQILVQLHLMLEQTWNLFCNAEFTLNTDWYRFLHYLTVDIKTCGCAVLNNYRTKSLSTTELPITTARTKLLLVQNATINQYIPQSLRRSSVI